MSKHRFYASGEIPFAWETKPGMSKVAPGGEELPKVATPAKGTPKLPPPPCPREARLMPRQVLHIPLPPCPFQDRPWMASNYQRSGGTWNDDPFLAAYMECTRSGRDRGRVAPPKQKKKKSGGGAGSSKEVMLGILSCKNVRDVVEDGVMRLSQLPSAQLRRRNVVGKWRERDSREHRSLIHGWSGS